MGSSCNENGENKNHQKNNNGLHIKQDQLGDPD
jgi:hypothetical protein